MSTYPRALGVPGDFFFHYTTREAAFEYILPDRQLRLSPAHLVNDPLESNPAFLGEALGLSDNPEVDYENEVAAMEAGMRLQQLRRHSKVLSLTIDAPGQDGNAEVFGRGYARARMWQQYAENHQGVCVMFRREPLQTKALSEIQGRTAGAWVGPVSYTQRGILGQPGSDADPQPGHHRPLMLSSSTSASTSSGSSSPSCWTGRPSRSSGSWSRRPKTATRSWTSETRSQPSSSDGSSRNGKPTVQSRCARA